MFVFGILLFKDNLKLYFHLNHNYHERWKELTSLFGLYGSSNPFKWFPYIYNDLDNSDFVILKLKRNLRRNFKIFLLLFSVIILFLFF